MNGVHNTQLKYKTKKCVLKDEGFNRFPWLSDQ